MSDLAEEKFVSLTTYRRTGVPVAVPVWIARDGDEWVVTTPADTGKVRRLRHDPRVEMRPSSRFGRVEPDAEVVGGTARVIEDPATCRRMADPIRRKYGVQYRVMLFLEKLFSRKSRDRVILRITPGAAG
ncbi:PPOX class F420-dependent oxidoreductase [Paractinoplanes ferrugineus]|nr:PPOX class F420-dependent oxidoreductase [Actinoplanes ferrugineus]